MIIVLVPIKNIQIQVIISIPRNMLPLSDLRLARAQLFIWPIWTILFLLDEILQNMLTEE